MQYSRVLNAYDKATFLCGARVPPEIADPVSKSLPEVFLLSELQEAAGREIAETTGAESGCVTSCAAACITLGVAAAMVGDDRSAIARLPDPGSHPRRIVIQKGHCINFGAPVSQLIRLAGGELAEAGLENGCSEEHIRAELRRAPAAAVFAVESYHTAQYDGVPLVRLAEIAHEEGVPLLVDAATQELRLPQLVRTGADLIGCSAHKYFSAPTAGVLAGRRDLIEAVLLQSGGIGRTMKVGKEGIVGVIAALKAFRKMDMDAWRRREDAKILRVVAALEDVPGLRPVVSPDPNGCPFLRAEVVVDESVLHCDVRTFAAKLLTCDPVVVVRVYGGQERTFHINATELTDDEVGLVCQALAATAAACVRPTVASQRGR
ncbi:MAG: aminotransferase class V-fold PLP-dependent enzyme [Lentisphaeria bacterium]|nr:aminotransferase class V-fold PLP-dependent enzyme [Lentisphaeria bacterium]